MTDEERKLLIVIACTVLRLHPRDNQLDQTEHQIIRDALAPFRSYINHMKDNA